MFKPRHLPGLLLSAAMLWAAPLLASWQVQGLKCELAVDPLGIDDPHPRLFWQIDGAGPRPAADCMQVLVATSPDVLAADHGDLWDSGRIMSDQTTFVRYAGATLASSQQVYWKVRSWDESGQASAWSPPATWTLGLLSPTDWRGQWIAAAGDTESLLLRREFTVRPGLRRAVVHASGLGQFELFLNGARVGSDFLSPGWTTTTPQCSTRHSMSPPCCGRVQMPRVSSWAMAFTGWCSATVLRSSPPRSAHCGRYSTCDSNMKMAVSTLWVPIRRGARTRVRSRRATFLPVRLRRAAVAIRVGRFRLRRRRLVARRRCAAPVGGAARPGCRG